jgi:type VII secretion integral membrane protein EccD
VSEPSMTEGFCRITVVTPRRRMDLTMPTQLACAELVPEVLRLAGETDQGPSPRPWVLGRLGEPPLAPERTLSQSGVYDGDLLYLRAAGQPADPVVVDDLVETIAEAVDGRGGRWTAATWHRFAMAAAAALLGAGAVAVGAGGRPLAGTATGGRGTAWLAAGAALALLLAALGLRRLLREPVAAATLALAALPWSALAGVALAGRAGTGPAAAVAAGSGGLLAGAVAAAVAAPAVTGPCLAVALPAAALALAAAAVAAVGATPAQTAAVLAVALVPALTALPRLAIAMAGISPGDEDAEVAVQAERAKVAVGHALLTWVLGGAALTLTAALAVLAAGGTLARCLAAAVALSVGLRARGFRLVGEVLPLALAVLGGVVALELAVMVGPTAGPARQWPGAGLLVGTAVLLALAGFLLRGAGPSPGVRRRLDLVEALANLVLVPLALGVLGLYGAVERLAQRLGG